MQQQIVKGDVLQRLAGISFIGGAILTLVFNALFPRADDPSDVAQVLTKLAGNETLSQAVGLGIAVGIWAMMIGVVGVYRSIASGGAAVWARLGFYGIVVGTTMFTASLAVVLSQVDVAVSWVAAGSGAGVSEYSAGTALHAVGRAMLDMTAIVFWLALVFLGVGMVLSSVYPKWLGWSLIILGAVIVVVAFITRVSDPSQGLDIAFAIPAGLTSVWALVLGVWITRKAW